MAFDEEEDLVTDAELANPGPDESGQQPAWDCRTKKRAAYAALFHHIYLAPVPIGQLHALTLQPGQSLHREHIGPSGVGWPLSSSTGAFAARTGLRHTLKLVQILQCESSSDSSS